MKKSIRRSRVAVGALLSIAGLVLFLSLAPRVAAEGNERVHVVSKGENLFRLALRYNTTVAALLRANGLTDPNYVQAGARLVIPQTPALGAPPEKTASGETPRLHIVAAGQNLFRLSLQYGVPLAALLEANGLTNPNYVQAGQRLVIPARAPEAAPPSPPKTGEPTPSEGPLHHAVERGQNLFRIALQYGSSVVALMEANALQDPHYLRVGQILIIPAASGSPRAVPLPPPVSVLARLGLGPAGIFRLTFYCLVGPMASGRWVYLGAAAADQSTFRLGTRVWVEDFGNYVIEDRFAWDAAEKRLDIWRPSCAEALQLGVMYKAVTVLSLP